MEIRIIQIGTSPAVRLAAEEIKKYLPKIDPCVETAILFTESDVESLHGIKVGLLEKEDAFFQVPDPELDDAILIDVSEGNGVITGSNPRSVLIAAYRFLREAGCRWIRPGEGGEKIIPGNIKELKVSIKEKASYRHRGVCVEGASSYNHIRQMIEWMPKVGLNGYFHQFFVPYTFLDKWYSHKSNPTLQPQKASVEEIEAMVESTICTVKEREMMLHRVGHGWTCEPFGIPGLGWDPVEYHLSDEEAAPFAMIDGKRQIFNGISLNTNLCYSNREVRSKVVEAIANYAKQHSSVDYLHFWLADEKNNHCECDGCKDTRPSDFYVQLLNEIDARLTEEKLKTRIVFLVYMDLLWAPVENKIIHEDRFTLMFAPISRTYTTTFLQNGEIPEGETEPYVRNRNVLPKKVEDNVAYLRKWQEHFSNKGIDGFDYDYHILWDWNFDLGGYRSAQVLFEDMINLEKLDLHGMMSCQLQRAAFPTALGTAAMASALWNTNQSFEAVADTYFTDVFGAEAHVMKEYFKTLSERLHPPYQRMEEETVNPERVKDFASLTGYIQEKLPRFEQLQHASENWCDRRTWEIVLRHAEICLLMAEVLRNKAEGNQDKALECWKDVEAAAERMEMALNDVWDVDCFLSTVGAAVCNTNRPGLD